MKFKSPLHVYVNSSFFYAPVVRIPKHNLSFTFHAFFAIIAKEVLQMKKTFLTTMPNKVGAFLTAGKIFSGLGLNITRVSYNKALDSHMLFIEAEGEKAAMEKAALRLREIGYLQSTGSGRVILLQFKLADKPGTLCPVLELIEKFSINISYLSSESDGSGFQLFKMGLFIKENDEISAFLAEASKLCDVEVLDYDPSGISLDNTVFYVSFANRISSLLKLDEKEKRRLTIDSNLIMELLTKNDLPPYKTFEYIGKFAEAMTLYKGEAFSPRVTNYSVAGAEITLIEPPVGSNVCLLRSGSDLLVFDGGFASYKEETLRLIKALCPGFGFLKRSLVLTHADIDHVGIAEYFPEIYVSQKCFDNFISDSSGTANIRERNPLHAPYVRISKILSHYKPLDINALRVIGGLKKPVKNITHIGNISFGELNFACYEAPGGHVPGETVFIEKRLHIAFTGDILVNLKGFTPEQKAFNSLAPYLMTSVDTDPRLAARERKEFYSLLEPGHWLIFGGHGAPIEADV